ncbi:MAG: hypothetical protein HY347_10070 [candidate division NC10 bacterium]|nr:hypothetical protein [candidate division NC10 bacterium]
MALPSIKHDLLEELNRLKEEDQRRVLDFARALARKTPKGTPGKALLRHAGSIPPEELDRMSKAIEEGCEQVNLLILSPPCPW